jgi:DNA-binding NarL/FixJ family response regulator
MMPAGKLCGNPGPFRVLIADDHPLVCEWLTNFIKQEPDLSVCGEAASAAEALRKVETTAPDLAIVDISLKDSSGIELIKDLRRVRPGLLVLVLTMHDERLYAERALRAGARGYVMKREATSKVIQAIRAILDGKLYLSEAMSQAVMAQFVKGGKSSSTAPISQFSDRELVIFDLLGHGQSTRRIARSLGVSIKTVQACCARMKQKLNLQSSTELLREALRRREGNEN